MLHYPDKNESNKCIRKIIWKSICFIVKEASLTYLLYIVFKGSANEGWFNTPAVQMDYQTLLSQFIRFSLCLPAVVVMVDMIEKLYKDIEKIINNMYGGDRNENS